jgi:hypothetical protein
METSFINWKKSAEGQHILFHKEVKMGEMVIKNDLFRKSAVISHKSQTYQLKRSGFWKSNIEIIDGNGQVILKSHNEKWYSKTARIEFEGKEFNLVIRNNPLVEYSIFDGNTEILSYALDVFKGKATTKIQTSRHHNSYLLDFYLWFLFMPVAKEKIVDDGTYLLLTTA